MNKYQIFLLMLCLFTFACEQESITSELASPNNELTDRGGCDLRQIPLFIPASESVEGQIIDFDAKFAVTKSADYEAANGANVNIEQISYNVNGAASARQITYEDNHSYELSIGVKYTVNGMPQQEIFSLCFRVEGERLKWGCTNYCEDREEGTLDSRTDTASLILP